MIPKSRIVLSLQKHAHHCAHTIPVDDNAKNLLFSSFGNDEIDQLIFDEILMWISNPNWKQTQSAPIMMGSCQIDRTINRRVFGTIESLQKLTHFDFPRNVQHSTRNELIHRISAENNQSKQEQWTRSRRRHCWEALWP